MEIANQASVEGKKDNFDLSHTKCWEDVSLGNKDVYSSTLYIGFVI